MHRVAPRVWSGCFFAARPRRPEPTPVIKRFGGVGTGAVGGGVLRIGTVLSGTDVWVGVWEAVLRSIESMFGTTVKPGHVFSCEQVVFKQDTHAS